MTAPTITQRPYGRAAIDATYQYLDDHDDNNPCIVVPTGGGKSVIMGGLAQEVITRFPGRRICVTAHVRELVGQNADKLTKIWPGAPLGIYSASLRRRDRFEPIIFASIQSVYDKAPQLGRFDLILVDECHRIPLKSEGTYRRFLADCKRINPHLRVIGFTASPWRLGGGPICAPENVLNEVAYDVPLTHLIDEGYLVRPISKNGVARPDLSDVHTRGGEYIEGEAAQAMMRGNLVARACDEIVQLCANRRAWILFAASIAHAERIRDELTARGIAGAIVSGETPSAQRDAHIAAFRAGALRYLVTINVLAEGYDEPRIDTVIMLRPTKSPVVYTQQVGRGTRVNAGPDFNELQTAEQRLAAIASSVKRDFLVLDFACNILEHGPVDCIVVEKPKKRGDKALRKAPAKECPQCHAVHVVQVRTCDQCGYEWPAAEAKHDDTATDAPILSTELATRHFEHKVTAISYGKYEKPGKPPCMLVTYSCGLRWFREFVPFEYGSEARARAVQWWNERNMTRDLLVPRTVDDALGKVDTHLRKPASLTVNHAGRREDIVRVNF
jgi:DNA repair protein RadD